MKEERHLSFDAASFETATAHGGRNTIQVARAPREVGSSCNFIDLCVVPVGSSIGMHTHGDQDEEIYVVIDGHGEMIVDDDRIAVGSGDVVVNRLGGTHGLINDGDVPLRIVVLDIAT